MPSGESDSWCSPILDPAGAEEYPFPVGTLYGCLDKEKACENSTDRFFDDVECVFSHGRFQY